MKGCACVPPDVLCQLLVVLKEYMAGGRHAVGHQACCLQLFVQRTDSANCATKEGEVTRTLAMLKDSWEVDSRASRRCMDAL